MQIVEQTPFVEDYEFLREQGLSNARIAERFGVRLASLKRRALRHDCWRPDRTPSTEWSTAP